MAEDLEKVPGGLFIEYGELRKYREFTDFKIIDSDGEEVTVKYDKDICIACNHYYEIWDNCREFGLPEKDWTRNPVWLVDIMKSLNRIYREIEIYRDDKSNWKAGR